MSSIAVIGGGPAGLMAAEFARNAGLEVELYERQGSVGRKFLLAGKGGLNLTHSERFEAFVARYGSRAADVRPWLADFDADALRGWARELGIETFVGSSGRVFPLDLKAAPLLRRWIRRLRASGVRIHVHHNWRGMNSAGEQCFTTTHGDRCIQHSATILALGGASWPTLGSDGAWTGVLQQAGVDVAPLLPSNCGFEVAWSDAFATRYAGAPVKSVVLSIRDLAGQLLQVRGEFVVSAYGVEGSAIYALSPALRDAIAQLGSAELTLDLAPTRSSSVLESALSRPRQRRSLSEHLRRTIGIDGVKAGLLYEVMARTDMNSAGQLARTIKALPLRVLRPRPLAEAISTAGGVRFGALSSGLMLKSLPGVFCAGEMLDWEAPTGGYLLSACLASGRAAAAGAVHWLATQ